MESFNIDILKEITVKVVGHLRFVTHNPVMLFIKDVRKRTITDEC